MVTTMFLVKSSNVQDNRNSPNISVMSSKTALQTYVEHASPSLSHTKQ